MTIYLCVDPGKMSGIAAISYDYQEAPELVASGEYDARNYHKPIIETIVASYYTKTPIKVICERFTINAQTVKNSQAPYSLEQIGVLKHLMLVNGLEPDDIVFQSPSDAKRMFDNSALKKLDFWHKGGDGHALDAIRHGLLAVTKDGWVPRALLQ
jgi:hypothetical protein